MSILSSTHAGVEHIVKDFCDQFGLSADKLKYVDEGCYNYCGDFVINSDGTKQLSRLPVKLNVVLGDFICTNCGLTTLENCPKFVAGSFSVSRNKLVSLEHAPGHVGGDFVCSNNMITSLSGCTKHVQGFFACRHNMLVDLKGGPTKVGSHFNCVNNNITVLDGLPLHIGGMFLACHNCLPPAEIKKHAMTLQHICQGHKILPQKMNLFNDLA